MTHQSFPGRLSNPYEPRDEEEPNPRFRLRSRGVARLLAVGGLGVGVVGIHVAAAGAAQADWPGIGKSSAPKAGGSTSWTPSTQVVKAPVEKSAPKTSEVSGSPSFDSGPGASSSTGKVNSPGKVSPLDSAVPRAGTAGSPISGVLASVNDRREKALNQTAPSTLPAAVQPPVVQSPVVQSPVVQSPLVGTAAIVTPEPPANPTAPPVEPAVEPAVVKDGPPVVKDAPAVEMSVPAASVVTPEPPANPTAPPVGPPVVQPPLVGAASAIVPPEPSASPAAPPVGPPVVKDGPPVVKDAPAVEMSVPAASVGTPEPPANPTAPPVEPPVVQSPLVGAAAVIVTPEPPANPTAPPVEPPVVKDGPPVVKDAPAVETPAQSAGTSAPTADPVVPPVPDPVAPTVADSVAPPADPVAAAVAAVAVAVDVPSTGATAGGEPGTDPAAAATVPPGTASPVEAALISEPTRSPDSGSDPSRTGPPEAGSGDPTTVTAADRPQAVAGLPGGDTAESGSDKLAEKGSGPEKSAEKTVPTGGSASEPTAPAGGSLPADPAGGDAGTGATPTPPGAPPAGDPTRAEADGAPAVSADPGPTVASPQSSSTPGQPDIAGPLTLAPAANDAVADRTEADPAPGDSTADVLMSGVDGKSGTGGKSVDPRPVESTARGTWADGSGSGAYADNSAEGTMVVGTAPPGAGVEADRPPAGTGAGTGRSASSGGVEQSAAGVEAGPSPTGGEAGRATTGGEAEQSRREPLFEPSTGAFTPGAVAGDTGTRFAVSALLAPSGTGSPAESPRRDDLSAGSDGDGLFVRTDETSPWTAGGDGAGVRSGSDGDGLFVRSDGTGPWAVGGDRTDPQTGSDGGDGGNLSARLDRNVGDDLLTRTSGDGLFARPDGTGPWSTGSDRDGLLARDADDREDDLFVRRDDSGGGWSSGDGVPDDARTSTVPDSGAPDSGTATAPDAGAPDTGAGTGPLRSDDEAGVPTGPLGNGGQVPNPAGDQTRPAHPMTNGERVTYRIVPGTPGGEPTQVTLATLNGREMGEPVDLGRGELGIGLDRMASSPSLTVWGTDGMDTLQVGFDPAVLREWIAPVDALTRHWRADGSEPGIPSVVNGHRIGFQMPVGEHFSDHIPGLQTMTAAPPTDVAEAAIQVDCPDGSCITLNAGGNLTIRRPDGTVDAITPFGPYEYGWGSAGTDPGTAADVGGNPSGGPAGTGVASASSQRGRPAVDDPAGSGPDASDPGSDPGSQRGRTPQAGGGVRAATGETGPEPEDQPDDGEVRTLLDRLLLEPLGPDGELAASNLIPSQVDQLPGDPEEIRQAVTTGRQSVGAPAAALVDLLASQWRSGRFTDQVVRVLRETAAATQGRPASFAGVTREAVEAASAALRHPIGVDPPGVRQTLSALLALGASTGELTGHQVEQAERALRESLDLENAGLAIARGNLATSRLRTTGISQTDATIRLLREIADEQTANAACALLDPGCTGVHNNPAHPIADLPPGLVPDSVRQLGASAVRRAAEVMTGQANGDTLLRLDAGLQAMSRLMAAYEAEQGRTPQQLPNQAERARAAATASAARSALLAALDRDPDGPEAQAARAVYNRSLELLEGAMGLVRQPDGTFAPPPRGDELPENGNPLGDFSRAHQVAAEAIQSITRSEPTGSASDYWRQLGQDPSGPDATASGTTFPPAQAGPGLSARARTPDQPPGPEGDLGFSASSPEDGDVGVPIIGATDQTFYLTPDTDPSTLRGGPSQAALLAYLATPEGREWAGRMFSLRREGTVTPQDHRDFATEAGALLREGSMAVPRLTAEQAARIFPVTPPQELARMSPAAREEARQRNQEQEARQYEATQMGPLDGPELSCVVYTDRSGCSGIAPMLGIGTQFRTPRVSHMVGTLPLEDLDQISLLHEHPVFGAQNGPSVQDLREAERLDVYARGFGFTGERSVATGIVDLGTGTLTLFEPPTMDNPFQMFVSSTSGGSIPDLTFVAGTPLPTEGTPDIEVRPGSTVARAGSTEQYENAFFDALEPDADYLARLEENRQAVASFWARLGIARTGPDAPATDPSGPPADDEPGQFARMRPAPTGAGGTTESPERPPASTGGGVTVAPDVPRYDPGLDPNAAQRRVPDDLPSAAQTLGRPAPDPGYRPEPPGGFEEDELAQERPEVTGFPQDPVPDLVSGLFPFPQGPEDAAAAVGGTPEISIRAGDRSTGVPTAGSNPVWDFATGPLALNPLQGGGYEGTWVLGRDGGIGAVGRYDAQGNLREAVEGVPPEQAPRWQSMNTADALRALALVTAPRLASRLTPEALAAAARSGTLPQGLAGGGAAAVVPLTGSSGGEPAGGRSPEQVERTGPPEQRVEPVSGGALQLAPSVTPGVDGDEQAFSLEPGWTVTVLPDGTQVSQHVSEDRNMAFVHRPDGTVEVRTAGNGLAPDPVRSWLDGAGYYSQPEMGESVLAMPTDDMLGDLSYRLAIGDPGAEALVYGDAGRPVTSQSSFAERNAESLRRSGSPLCGGDAGEVDCIDPATFRPEDPASRGVPRIGTGGGVRIEDPATGRVRQYVYCTTHRQFGCVRPDPEGDGVGHLVVGSGGPSYTDASGRQVERQVCSTSSQIECVEPGTNRLRVGGGRPTSVDSAGRVIEAPVVINLAAQQRRFNALTPAQIERGISRLESGRRGGRTAQTRPTTNNPVINAVNGANDWAERRADEAERWPVVGGAINWLRDRLGTDDPDRGVPRRYNGPTYSGGGR